MLREIAHLVRYAPGALRLKATARSQAELYDTLMARGSEAGMDAYRRDLVRGLSGDVLEIGSGTGLMFPHYDAAVRLTAMEPDAEFRDLAETRAAASPASVTLTTGSAEALPYPDASFDAVVIALVLCSVASVGGALREASRVLREAGELRLIEHVRSEKAVAGAVMDLVNPLWLRLNGQSCHLNRDPVPALLQTGFSIIESTPFQIFSPGLPAFPMRMIRAKYDAR